MIVLKVWGKITTWKISKCPLLGRTPTPESAVPVLWTTYFQMLFLDYFLLSLKSLPPYYPGFHAQTLGGPSLIMRSDLVRLYLSFSWPVSSILPSKNTLWWKFVVFPAVLNGGGGRIRGGENFILQKTSLCENRIIQPQMSIVLRLRNPGIHKCLPSFRGLCLENPMDRVAWQGYSPWGCKRVRRDLATRQEQQQQQQWLLLFLSSCLYIVPFYCILFSFFKSSFKFIRSVVSNS